MTMGVIAAVAEFERDLLIERTQAGLARPKEKFVLILSKISALHQLGLSADTSIGSVSLHDEGLLGATTTPQARPPKAATKKDQ